MRSMLFSLSQTHCGLAAGLRVTAKLLATLIAMLALQFTVVSTAFAATPKIMVVGDSISAGFLQPSYRKALLDGFDAADCSVDMVGDQTQNSFSFNNPTALPGAFEDGFSPANGYDTEHQAFGGIRAEQIFTGFTSGAGVTIDPIGNYVAAEQPDYVLLHAGTNDLSLAVDTIDAAGIPAWATTTTNDMDNIINEILDVMPSAKIIVGNFIPRKSESVPALASLEAQMNIAYRNELESRISSRGDSRVMIADVATGFDSDTMTTDGVHPNNVGEQHLAGAFETVLFGAGLCQGSNPAVTNPTSGSIVEGTTATLNWTNNGAAVNSWWVYAGASQSGDADEYFNSGRITDAGARSIELTGLPADGSQVYVGLWYKVGSIWDFSLVNYTNNATGGGGGGGDTPAVTSPAAGSTISGSSFTLNWSANGQSVSDWWVFAGSSAIDDQADDYFNSDRISNNSATSTVVSGMPEDGSTVYVRLWFKIGGTWNHETLSYTSASNGGGGTTPPSISSPASGQTINGTSAVISWNANDVTASSWQVNVGSSAGGSNIFSGPALAGTATSTTISNLPNDGTPIFVTLSYQEGGGATEEVSANYTSGTAPSGGDSPAVTSPASGSSISGGSFTLNWSANGASVDQWWVFAGDSPASQDDDYFNSGRLTSSASNAVVTGMPEDGSTVHIGLWFKIAGTWDSETYTYTSVDSGSGGGGTTPPALTSPAAGSTINGTSAVFSWTANDTSVTRWALIAGSTPGGNDIDRSGTLAASTTSVQLDNLPNDGSTVYVTLRYDDGSGFTNITASFTSGTSSTGGGDTPAISSPAGGSSISGSSFTLNWASNGQNVSDWWVFAGASAASQSDDYFNSNRISDDNATSVIVTGMPQDGSTVYVALWFKVAGIWSSDVITYTSADGGGGSTSPPAITSPAAGATINGTSATFSWATNGTPVSSMQIDVGSSAGGDQYDSTGSIAASTGSATLGNLPNDGSTIFVTLSYTSGGSNLSRPSVSYTSGTAGGGGTGDIPAISSPADGSTISGASYTLNWNRNGANVTEYFVFMGNNPTSTHPDEYFVSGRICVLDSAGNPKNGANNCDHEIPDASSNSFVVSGMPQDGSEVIVALWFKINGVWLFNKPLLELDRYISASSGGGGGGDPGTGTGEPEIDGPADGSTISGDSFTLNWDGNGAAVTDWWVFVGDDANDDQSDNIFTTGRIENSSTDSASVTGMPQDGTTVYVRLWYKVANSWSHIEYSYTSEDTGSSITPPPPPSS